MPCIEADCRRYSRHSTGNPKDVIGVDGRNKVEDVGHARVCLVELSSVNHSPQFCDR